MHSAPVATSENAGEWRHCCCCYAPGLAAPACTSGSSKAQLHLTGHAPHSPQLKSLTLCAFRSGSNKGHVGRAPADGKNIGKPDSSVSRRRLKRSECGAKNELGGLRAEFHKYYGGTAQCPPGGHLNKGRMEAKFS